MKIKITESVQHINNPIITGGMVWKPAGWEIGFCVSESGGLLG